MKWHDVKQLHAKSSADVAATAENVPRDRWSAPRAEGKWSPAEIIEHLSLTYDILLSELAGGSGMRIRTSLWQRVILRFTILPRILRGEPFPRGIRAPREIRPANASPDQVAAIAAFRERATRFEAAMSDTHEKNPRARLTHPYFGRSTIDNAMLVCTRHLQHHHAQLMESHVHSSG